MGCGLKFREHGLAEQGASEAFQEVVDQIALQLLILGLLQEMADQQGFIAGGGHLRHKDLIAGVDIGLRAVCVVGMDGVAHLMGQGEHVV